MNFNRLASLGVAGILLCSATASRADTDSDRIKKLEDQVRLLLEQQTKLKDQQTDNDKLIATLLADLKEAKAKTKPQDSMMKDKEMKAETKPGVKISGDVTTRFELNTVGSLQNGSIPEGEEGLLRGRFRLKLDFPINQRSDAQVYLTTQGANPAAQFVNMGDAFRGKGISFTRAQFNYYFQNPDADEYKAEGVDGRHYVPFLRFGKMQNPFWKGEIGGPGGFASEAVWDNDVNPEGIALTIPFKKPGRDWGITSTTAFFVINTPANRRDFGLTSNTYEVNEQIKAEYKDFTLGLNWRVIDNLNSGLYSPFFQPGFGIDFTPGTSAFLLRSGIGLQTSNAHYGFNTNIFGFGANTFSLFNLQFNYAPKIGQFQPFVHYEYLTNSSVRFAQNGFSISGGVARKNPRVERVGSQTKRGDYTFWFTYRDIDADATLATFADSDLGVGTDYRGYQLGFNYFLHDNLALRLAYHDFENSPNKTNTLRRFFLDFAKSF